MIDFIWSEKYRPRTIKDTILPTTIKSSFESFVVSGNIPNLMLTGGSGVGKTTVARAMLDECDIEYIMINGSMDGNIGTLRNDIMNFASTVSFFNKKKFVILDEADFLNPTSTQPALRNFIQEFSENCGFIFTCNYPNKILKALHSRCAVIEFKLNKEEKIDVAKQFLKRCIYILDEEKIKYDKAAVAHVVTKFFPDMRRCLNELQRYSAATGEIDSGILVNFAEVNLKHLIKFLKDKDFSSMRKWVAENNDIDTVHFYRQLYDNAVHFFTPIGAAQLIIHLSDFQEREAFVPDKEINTAAMLTKIMIDCEFK